MNWPSSRESITISLARPRHFLGRWYLEEMLDHFHKVSRGRGQQDTWSKWEPLLSLPSHVTPVLGLSWSTAASRLPFMDIQGPKWHPSKQTCMAQYQWISWWRSIHPLFSIKQSAIGFRFEFIANFQQQHFRQMSILRPAPVKMIVVESEKHKLNSCLVALGGSWWLLATLRTICVFFLEVLPCFGILPMLVPIKCLASSVWITWTSNSWIPESFFLDDFFWPFQSPSSFFGSATSRILWLAWRTPELSRNMARTLCTAPRAGSCASQQNRWFILEQSGTEFPILSGDCQQHALASR